MLWWVGCIACRPSIIVAATLGFITRILAPRRATVPAPVHELAGNEFPLRHLTAACPTQGLISGYGKKIGGRSKGRSFPVKETET